MYCLVNDNNCDENYLGIYCVIIIYFIFVYCK